jgi:mannose-6-phosphate isomerase
MRKIFGDIKPYAWGDSHSISDFLGIANPDGKPQAELWVGTHPLSPSRLSDGTSLRDVLELHFLVKLLAAASPLSIQVHPSREEAIEGFLREEELGILLDSPQRNYKDVNHKPEMIISLSEKFHALVGFKENSEIIKTIQSLLEVSQGDVTGLLYVLDYAQSDSRNPRGFNILVQEILKSDLGARIAEEITSILLGIENSLSLNDELDNLLLAVKHYPNDRGLSLGLLMNYRVLNYGEALYLPSNEIHAYMRGFGLEIMAESDNVLRCGLTPKHIDVEELGKLLSTKQSDYAKLEPKSENGFEVWEPTSDFQVKLAVENLTVKVVNPAILFIATENRELEALFPNLAKGDFYLADSGEIVSVPKGSYLISSPLAQ